MVDTLQPNHVVIYPVETSRVPDASTMPPFGGQSALCFSFGFSNQGSFCPAAQCRGIFFNWLKYILAHTEDTGHRDTDWLCGRFQEIGRNEDMCSPDTSDTCASSIPHTSPAAKAG